MLLTNRRHRLLFVVLAGMEVAWFLPFAMLFAARLARLPSPQHSALSGLLAVHPAIVFGLLWATLLLYLLVADLLNRWQIDSPLREAAMLLLVLVTSLAGIRLLLYPGAPLDELSWLGNTLQAIYDFTDAMRPELVILLVNFFLWLRVAVSSDRELSFFGVGVSFRLGMLLALLGNTLLTTWGGQATVLGVRLFAYFFACGLVAVALARIDDKAMAGMDSTGALLPWSRLLQIVAASLLTLGIALGVARLLTVATIRTILGWFSPLWHLLGLILAYLSLLLFQLLTPPMEWLVRLLRSYVGDLPEQEFEFGEAGEASTFVDVVREWTAMRYCLVTALIVAGMVVLWLLFVRTRNRPRPDEAEAASQSEFGFGAGMWASGWERLRQLLALMRRYGVGTHLLAAISVQNIYANLGRLARQRGFARRVSQSPDDYLPDLCRAFPGHDDELAAITTAYMRVHYGDLPIEAQELDGLRAAYELLIALPPPDQK